MVQEEEEGMDTTKRGEEEEGMNTTKRGEEEGMTTTKRGEEDDENDQVQILASRKKSSPPLWGWAMETLADFKRINSSTLDELVKKVPNEELESLKAITATQSPTNIVPVNPPRISSVVLSTRFAFSLLRCPNTTNHDRPSSSEPTQNLYRGLVHKPANASIPEASMLDSCIMDVSQFVGSKNSHLPKCTLQEVKEALINGRHPSAAKLWGLSGLKGKYQEQPARLLACSETGGNIQTQEANSGCLVSEIQGNALQGNPHAKSSNPTTEETTKRKEDQDLAGIGTANRVYNASNSSKQSMEIPESHAVNEISSPPAPENAMEIMQDGPPLRRSKRKRTESSTGRLKDCMNVDKTSMDTVVLKLGGQNLDTLPVCEPLEIPRGRRAQDLGKIGACADDGGKIQQVFSKKLRTTVNGGESSHGTNVTIGKFPFSSPSEDMEFTTVNNSLFNSQIASTEDSLDTDWAEDYSCIKCNKGGHLLICSACKLAVHQSCLGFSASSNDLDSFLCPVCSYSQAKMVCSEIKKLAILAKEKATLAMNRLSSFLNPGQDRKKVLNVDQSRAVESASFLNGKQKEMLNNPSRLSALHQQETEAACDCNDGTEIVLNGHEYAVLGPSDADLHQQPVNYSSPVMGRNSDSPCGGTETVLTSHEHADVGVEYPDLQQPDTRQQGHYPPVDATVDLPCVNRETVLNDPKLVDARNAEQQLLHSLEGRLPSLDDNTMETSKHKNDQNTVENSENVNDVNVKEHANVKNGGKRANPRNPSKRKKFSWSSEEEMKLQEGVEIYGKADTKNVPWRKILDFGQGVFQERRTAANLKDKWRRMNEEASKEQPEASKEQPEAS